MSLIYPFPVLHPESLDYENPDGYAAKMVRTGATGIEIEHEINRDNLVGELVEKGLAAFFVTVAVKGTIYRETEIAQKPDIHPGQEKFKAKQTLAIPAFRNNPTVWANCGIIALEDTTLGIDAAKGLTEFYKDEKKFTFPAHSVLAYWGWKRFFGLNALFTIINDSAIGDNGEFKCEIEASVSFRINIRMGRRLYDAVERDKNGKERAHVLCSALTQAFVELAEKHRLLEDNPEEEQDDNMLEQAQDLKKYLINEGISTWENNDFNAAYAASKCYPAIVDESSQD